MYNDVRQALFTQVCYFNNDEENKNDEEPKLKFILRTMSQNVSKPTFKFKYLEKCNKLCKMMLHYSWVYACIYIMYECRPMHEQFTCFIYFFNLSLLRIMYILNFFVCIPRKSNSG